METEVARLNRGPRFLHLFISVALGLGCALLVHLVMRDRIGLDRELAENGATTSGYVVALEPRQHETLRYRFSANGRTFTGEGEMGEAGPGFRSIRVGDSVLVHYLPRDPAVSRVGDPATLFRDGASTLRVMDIFAFLATALLAFAGLHLRRRSVPSDVPVTPRESRPGGSSSPSRKDPVP